MKTFFCLIILFLSVQLSAQNNQIVFDTQFVYGLKNENDINSDYQNLKIKLYTDETKSIGLIDIYSPYLKSDLNIFKNGRILKLSQFGFENSKISINEEPHLFNRIKAIDSLLNSKITFVPLHKKGEILGFSCDYYLIKSDLISDDVYQTNKICACIDTKNKNKNVKLIFPNSNIDGLILGYSYSQDGESMIVLKELNPINIKSSFDFDKAYIKAENEFIEFMNKEIVEDDHVFEFDESIEMPSNLFYYNYSRDPLCNSYLYFAELNPTLQNLANKFTKVGCYLLYDNVDFNELQTNYTRENIIQISKKQTEELLKQALKSKVITKDESKKLAEVFDVYYKDAISFIPTNEIPEVEKEAYDIWVGSGLESANRDYVSQYKELDIDHTNLAAESQSNQNLKRFMPNYCSEIKEKVPNFGNQNLKTHVYNFVGQICDLYLYQNGGNVDYFSTIDSMRKSLLEIENMKTKLSISDSTLLTNYLNSLD